MGKPATTYFCGNGHLLECNPDYCFGPRDMGSHSPCPHCGNDKEFFTTEWSDEETEFGVSSLPISYDDIQKTDHLGNMYFVRVPVFDISRLKINHTGETNLDPLEELSKVLKAYSQVKLYLVELSQIIIDISSFWNGNDEEHNPGLRKARTLAKYYLEFYGDKNATP